ncbi:flagellar hook-length control protein FliK [Arthrobacter ramosus]|uniref:Flagellar hook-length control protein FliK n=1 Tax=Arthrobacter ramosus TaxID=1672 RepID=A0ABV5Y1L8_ARTRM|nr:flagellar hook-length control protein FliK [Arthrobacter ramosus]
MQLPPAGAASPRPAVSGSPTVPQPGAAAGFEAVMNGVLASDSKTSDGTTQQAPDGGAQGKPAADSPGTVARAAKPEASKVAKDTVDAADTLGAVGAVDAASAVAAVVGGLAMAGVAPETAALQASGPGVAVPVKEGVVDGTAPAKTIAGTSETASLVVGMPAGSTQAAPAVTSSPAPVIPTPTVRAAPVGNPGQSSPQPGPIPTSPLPNSPQPAGTLPANPMPAGLEPGVNVTAARSHESGTAVVLPTGKPATQQDPQPVLGQAAPGAPIPGLPAGIQAGIPGLVQPASTLQQAPSTAAPGMATPTPQADPAKLLPQVSGPLFSLASAAPGAHVMILKLSPEDLGPLTVRAHIEGAGVRIELFAPGDAGREAVRSILPELRRGLGESGFGASLDLSERNAPADAGAGGSDPRDRRPAESPAFPRGSDGESVRLPRTAIVLPRSSTSSLDILV